MNYFPERGLLLIETHFDWYVQRKKFKAVWELAHYFHTVWGLSQITFALRVGRWSENHVVYYIKSAN